jgi:hypothetical protein
MAQAILPHCNVAVTRESYIMRDGEAPRSLAAMQALDERPCNYDATVGSEHEGQVFVDHSIQSISPPLRRDG